MTNNVIFKIVAVLLLVAVVIGIGVYAYQVGVAQGVAGAAQLQPGETGKAWPFAGMPYFHGRPFFGFSPFGFLVPLFLILLFIWALRAIFGCSYRHYYGGYWGHPGWWAMHHMHKMAENGEFPKGMPPFFEEWHRKAHEGQQTSDSGDKEAHS